MQTENDHKSFTVADNAGDDHDDDDDDDHDDDDDDDRNSLMTFLLAATMALPSSWQLAAHSRSRCYSHSHSRSRNHSLAAVTAKAAAVFLFLFFFFVTLNCLTNTRECGLVVWERESVCSALGCGMRSGRSVDSGARVHVLRPIRSVRVYVVVVA